MPSDRFQIAAARAASSYPADVWSSLGTSEQAPAIYRELRKLDEPARNKATAPVNITNNIRTSNSEAIERTKTARTKGPRALKRSKCARQVVVTDQFIPPNSAERSAR